VVADLYVARGSDAVVLAHGAAFDKARAPFAAWLAARGHPVLASTFAAIDAPGRARTPTRCSRTCSREYVTFTAAA